MNLANQLSLTLNESPQWKTTEILNLQLQQMKVPKWNQNPTSLPQRAIVTKSQDVRKKTCYKFKHFRHLPPSNQSFQCPLNSQQWGSGGLQGLFLIFPLNRIGETFLQTADESLPVLTDNGTTILVLNTTTIKQSLPWSTKTVQTVGSLMNPKSFLSLNLFPFV